MYQVYFLRPDDRENMLSGVRRFVLRRIFAIFAIFAIHVFIGSRSGLQSSFINVDIDDAHKSCVNWY